MRCCSLTRSGSFLKFAAACWLCTVWGCGVWFSSPSDENRNQPPVLSALSWNRFDEDGARTTTSLKLGPTRDRWALAKLERRKDSWKRFQASDTRLNSFSFSVGFIEKLNQSLWRLMQDIPFLEGNLQRLTNLSFKPWSNFHEKKKCQLWHLQVHVRVTYSYSPFSRFELSVMRFSFAVPPSETYSRFSMTEDHNAWGETTVMRLARRREFCLAVRTVHHSLWHFSFETIDAMEGERKRERRRLWLSWAFLQVEFIGEQLELRHRRK